MIGRVRLRQLRATAIRGNASDMNAIVPFLVSMAFFLVGSGLEVMGYENESLGRILLILGALCFLYAVFLTGRERGWFEGGFSAWRIPSGVGFKLEAQPDMSMIDAWEHLLLGSQWSIGKNPYDTPTTFFDDAQMQIKDAANLGKISIWGRRADLEKNSSTMSKIFLDDWGDVIIFTQGRVGLSRSARIHDSKTDSDFDDVMVNSRQVYSLWPKARKAELRKDKTFRFRDKYIHG